MHGALLESVERQRDRPAEKPMALLPLVQGEAREEEVVAAQMTWFVGGMSQSPGRDRVKCLQSCGHQDEHLGSAQ